MKIFANFAAMSIRQQRQHARLLSQARAFAAAAMAKELAHQINDPLQSLMNLLFLANKREGVGDEKLLPFHSSQNGISKPAERAAALHPVCGIDKRDLLLLLATNLADSDNQILFFELYEQSRNQLCTNMSCSAQVEPRNSSSCSLSPKVPSCRPGMRIY